MRRRGKTRVVFEGGVLTFPYHLSQADEDAIYAALAAAGGRPSPGITERAPSRRDVGIVYGRGNVPVKPPEPRFVKLSPTTGDGLIELARVMSQGLREVAQAVRELRR